LGLGYFWMVFFRGSMRDGGDAGQTGLVCRRRGPVQ
jgi:hypothetical protein